MTKIRITPLSKLLVCSPRWIRDLVVKGIIPDPVKGFFILEGVIPKYVSFLRGSKDKRLSQAQAAHLEMKTKKLQLEAKKLEGSLVPRTESKELIDRLVAGCEQAFRDLPNKLAPVLAMIQDKQNEQRLIAQIIKHEVSACWRDLAGVSRKETPIVLPGEAILVCLGLIRGDKNGEVIMYDRRVKVRDILEKYGSGIEALRIPMSESVDEHKPLTLL